MSSIRIAEGIQIASVILNAVLAVITFGYLRVTESLAATAQEQSRTMQE